MSINLSYKAITPILMGVMVAAFYLVKVDSEASGQNTTNLPQALLDSTSYKSSLGREQDNPKSNFSSDKLRHQLTGLGLQQLIDLRSSIDAWLEKYPSQSEEILILYSEKLALHNPALAIDLIRNHLDTHHALQQFGSKLVRDWLSNDSTHFRNHLAKLIIEESREGENEVTAIFNLLFKPCNEHLPLEKMLTTIELEFSSNSIKMQGYALEAAVGQFELGVENPDLHLLKEAYLERFQEEEFQPFAHSFIKNLAAENSKEAFDFFLQLPSGDNKDIMATSMIRELTISQPEITAEWLSNSETLDQLIPPDLDQESWESQFNELLSAYIEVLAEQFPDDALTNLDALFGKNFKNSFSKKIELLVQETRERQKVD